MKRSVCLFLLASFLFCACKERASNNTTMPALERLATLPIDSAYNVSLDSVRRHLPDADIRSLKEFYKQKYRYYEYSVSIASLEKASLYADSLLELYDDVKLNSTENKGYFDALTAKGNILFRLRQFNQAAVYYLEARSISQKYLDSCSYNSIARSMANIYYIQDRYLQAARNYKQAYYGTLNCLDKSSKNDRFFGAQSTVNTIGFAYENAGMLDSALYYYQVNYRELMNPGKGIDTVRVNDAKVVLYDNMGSIYLKKGEYARAEAALKISLHTPYSLPDGVRIPILLKLADLYLIQKKLEGARPMLDSARGLLVLFPSDLKAKLARLQSQYYVIGRNYDSAFRYQQQYIALNDTLIANRDKARSIDIERDFLNLQQRANIRDLQLRDERKSSYLLLVLIFSILVLTIAVLVERNRRQSRKNHKQLMQHNATLEQTLQKLELANNNYSRVLRVMAHDLKNPVSGIARIADIVVDSGKQKKDTIEMFDIIKESADSALATINDLLNSTLMNQGIEILNKQRTDLSQLLQQCVSLLKFRAEEKKQSIGLSGEQHVMAMVDREKLLRVFNNIIVNAIKFSPGNTEIQVAVYRNPDIMISIADHGIGIPTDHAEYIFHPFTPARREGTAGEQPYGLGLSICKQIIEGHGGKLWFESRPGGGTIFYIQLPS